MGEHETERRLLRAGCVSIGAALLVWGDSALVVALGVVVLAAGVWLLDGGR